MVRVPFSTLVSKGSHETLRWLMATTLGLLAHSAASSNWLGAQWCGGVSGGSLPFSLKNRPPIQLVLGPQTPKPPSQSTFLLFLKSAAMPKNSSRGCLRLHGCRRVQRTPSFASDMPQRCSSVWILRGLFGAGGVEEPKIHESRRTSAEHVANIPPGNPEAQVHDEYAFLGGDPPFCSTIFQFQQCAAKQKSIQKNEAE